jgi:hypothetical protein
MSGRENGFRFYANRGGSQVVFLAGASVTDLAPASGISPSMWTADPAEKTTFAESSTFSPPDRSGAGPSMRDTSVSVLGRFCSIADQTIDLMRTPSPRPLLVPDTGHFLKRTGLSNTQCPRDSPLDPNEYLLLGTSAGTDVLSLLTHEEDLPRMTPGNIRHGRCRGAEGSENSIQSIGLWTRYRRSPYIHWRI